MRRDTIPSASGTEIGLSLFFLFLFYIIFAFFSFLLHTSTIKPRKVKAEHLPSSLSAPAFITQTTAIHLLSAPFSQPSTKQFKIVNDFMINDQSNN